MSTTSSLFFTTIGLTFAIGLMTVGTTTTTTTTIVYAAAQNGGAAPNQNANDIAECNVTMTDPSSHNISQNPAQGCFHARDDQVFPGGTCEQLAEPVPSVPDDRQGAANFNCGLPSETNGNNNN
jgi:hypothetical protein